MNISKLFRLSRIANCVVTVHRHHRAVHTVFVKYWHVDTRRMAQKSITSFFKITPKKESVATVNNQNEVFSVFFILNKTYFTSLFILIYNYLQETSNVDKSFSEESSPPAPATKSTKRLRSESENESPAASRSPSPVSSVKVCY